MAYIGDKPSQTLASPTSQYFNGDGSTVAFTLNRAVNVAEDLEVFVNNVQQEPGVGKSYTATGTTLTFDAAPSAGTANVYVVYRGLAEVTTRLEHDANAALAATTGTFSDLVTVNTTNGAENFIRLHDGNLNYGTALGIGSSGDFVVSRYNGGAASEAMRIQRGNGNISIGVASGIEKLTLNNGNIRLSGTDDARIQFLSSSTGSYALNSSGGAAIRFHRPTSGHEAIAFETHDTGVTHAERMRIHPEGYVTMTYQPAFFAYNLNFPSGIAGNASGGSVLVNVGSHYATGTGRFTAPVAGTYVFYMMTQAYDSGNTTGLYQTALFRKNGATVGAETYHGWQPNDGNNHVQAQNTVIITLAANDYVEAHVVYGSRDIQNYFGGYLLG